MSLRKGTLLKRKLLSIQFLGRRPHHVSRNRRLRGCDPQALAENADVVGRPRAVPEKHLVGKAALEGLVCVGFPATVQTEHVLQVQVPLLKEKEDVDQSWKCEHSIQVGKVVT
jgi:hypothetical protein